MGKVKGLFVIAAIVLGLLLMLLVGLAIRPDDGKQPTRDGASTSQFSGVSPPLGIRRCAELLAGLLCVPRA